MLVCAPSNKAVLELLLRFCEQAGPRRAAAEVALVGDGDKLTGSEAGRAAFVHEALDVAAEELEACEAAVAALCGGGGDARRGGLEEEEGEGEGEGAGHAWCSQSDTRCLVRISHTAGCQRAARRWAGALRLVQQRTAAVAAALRARLPITYHSGLQQPIGALLAKALALLQRSLEPLEPLDCGGKRGCGEGGCGEGGCGEGGAPAWPCTRPTVGEG